MQKWAGFGAEAYATGTGEQRRIVLADGSAVDLNTRSRIEVDFREGSRDIHLLGGEAFFDVAKDPSRPFHVTSGTTVVRAVGTQFNVYRQSTQTVVTVVEGRVAVTESPAGSAAGPATVASTGSPGPGAAALELSAGQEVVVASRPARRADTVRTSVVRPMPTNVRAATSWRQRRLIFEDRALADVVAQFNRYNRRQLVIQDAGLAGERISGVFDADKPQDLLAFLARNGEVEQPQQHAARILLIPSN